MLCNVHEWNRKHVVTNSIYWKTDIFQRKHRWSFEDAIIDKGALTWANKAPFFSAKFEKFTRYGGKLELKKGTFSVPWRRSLKDKKNYYLIDRTFQNNSHISIGEFICTSESLIDGF